MSQQFSKMFLRGFIHATDLEREKAIEVLTEFCLTAEPDTQVEIAEGGYDAGFVVGREYQDHIGS